MASIVMTLKYILMRMRCDHTEGIYLYARSCAMPYIFNSKRARNFQECNGICILKMTRKFARNELHRERLEFNDERDW